MKKTTILLIVFVILAVIAIIKPSAVFSQANRTVFKITTTVTPPPQVTNTVGTSLVVIFNPRDVLKDVNFCLTIENTDGSDDFVNVQVEQRMDNTGIWTVLAWDDCDTLGEGVSCVYCVSGNAYRWIRMQGAATDANPVSCRVGYTANRG
jgi:hypothetical protein